MNTRKLWLLLFMTLFAFTSREADALLDIFTLTPGVALGGIITGIIASVLGGISISIAFEKLEFVDPPEMMEGYEGYNRRRWRRNAEDVDKEIRAERFRVEQFMDDVYQKDQSQCIEKMMCDIAKRNAEGAPMSSDELDILAVVEGNRNHGLVYKKMLIAQKVAAGGGDCQFLFDSCPLETFHMVKFVGQTTRKVTIAQTSL